MGRLFWKFFLFIWLGQLAAVFGTGVLFWAERQQFEAQMQAAGFVPPPNFDQRPPPAFDQPPPPGMRPPPPPQHRPRGGVPIFPILTGLFASIVCAVVLAWYFAKPIRHLRQAFEVAAEGDLSVRVSPLMAGRRDELADLGQGFDRMTERLDSLMRGQRQLLHDVSHEMRSPLARLQAAIGLARQQPARIENSLGRIERESERINLLVGELLTLSRLEAGVAQALENVEMADLLNDIVEDARFEGAGRQVSIEFKPEVVAEVRANPELLHRAIENVVRNALRFSPEGGVVEVVAGQTEHGILSIEISDNGPGVPADQFAEIFKPFFRSDAVATRKRGEGYGLGLAIAQKVIATVDGQIQAKNKPAGGLLVEIKLPVANNNSLP